MKKKLLSILLIVAMLLTMLPAGYAQGPDSGEIAAAGQEAELIPIAEETPEDEAAPLVMQAEPTEFRVNPLYRNVLSEEMLRAAFSDIRPQAVAPVVCEDLDDVVAAIREAMKAREESVTVRFSGSFSCNDALDDAMAHTGDPTEGDYLLWQFGGYSYGRSGNDTTYWLYYYTDADQEAEMDVAVAELMDELDLEDRSDYEKVRTVYDYICANITYDYEHLEEDPDYLLMYTAYGALIDKTAVCQGYAVLLYRLLLTAGVDVRVVTSPEHAWNIICLDGLYYAADSTWDAGLRNYQYFLLSVANMDKVEYHDREEPYNTPEFEAEYPFSPLDWYAGLAITPATFPDEIFRAYVKNSFDKDDNDFLSDEEIAAVTEIEVEGTHIASLKGVEYFPNLRVLNFWSDWEQGVLSWVDLSCNTKLEELSLGFTELTELDVTMLPKLRTLMVGFTKLQSIDLTQNPELEQLICSDSDFKSLDLSGNPKLKILDCCGNPDLLVLDIRPCPSLVDDYRAGGRHLEWMKEISQELYDTVIVYGGSGDGGMDDHDYNLAVNTWTTILAGDEPGIEGVPIDEEHFPDGGFRSYVADHFDPDGNGILSPEEAADVTEMNVELRHISSMKGIEFFPALKTLNCSNNQLTELDVTKNSALEVLLCAYQGSAGLTELDVTQNPALTALYCAKNKLTELDVTQNPMLVKMDCTNNQLTALDVTHNPALEELYCDMNQITALDVTQNPELKNLHCSGNQLTALDVTHNPALKELFCGDNEIGRIDVTQNPVLRVLRCASCGLTGLDVTQNPELAQLSCCRNSIATLDLSACPILVDDVLHGGRMDYESIYCYFEPGAELYVDYETELIVGVDLCEVTLDLSHVPEDVYIGLDNGRKYGGEISFPVASPDDRAMLVVAKTGDNYTVLPAGTNVYGEHSFTLNVTAETEIVLVYKGDADLNGKVNMRDGLAIKKHSAGTAPLGELAALAANADGNGSVNMRDGLAVKKQSAGTAMIAW